MGRCWFLGVAVALLACTSAAAQADGEPFELLTDPQGDVELSVAGLGNADPTGAQVLDLVSASVSEDPQAFVFELVTGHVPASGEPRADAGRLTLDLEHNGRLLRIEWSVGQTGYIYAYLYAFDPGQERYDWVAFLPSSVDLDRNALQAEVDRRLLADDDGAPPMRGRMLEGFRATSRGLSAPPWVDMHDVMPDEGRSSAVYNVTFGVAQRGDAEMSAEEPFRASNGEATTYVFEAEVHNLADENGTFDLATVGVPSGWVVTLPAVRIDVPGNASVVVPVVARVPFAHQHGAQASFIVEASSITDPRSVGRVELGVLYLAVPQPSGHHDTLWLHSTADESAHAQQTQGGPVETGSERAFMNGVEDFDGDHRIGVRAQGGWVAPDRHYWWVGLSEGLRLGIDMDLEGEGSLRVPIHTPRPLLQAFLEGVIQACWPTEERFPECANIAVIAPTAPRDMDADTEATFEAVVTPLEAGDYLPYRAGSSMGMWIELRAESPGVPSLVSAVAPELRPGGSVRLPLLEYHDPVDATFAGSLVQLDADVRQKRVNSGETVRFPAELRNDGAAALSVRLDILGARVEWASLDRPGLLELGPGERLPVTVSVQAPADAMDGDAADLVLEAVDVDDPLVRSLLRLVATVDNQQDLEDEGVAPAVGSRESPPLQAAVAVALLAVAGIWRRRSP